MDRNSLVSAVDAENDGKVRAEWNQRLISKVAPVAYAQLLSALVGERTKDHTVHDWLSRERVSFPAATFYQLFPVKCQVGFQAFSVVNIGGAN